MSNLFAENEEADIEQPPELATPKQVRLLEGYSYRREAVRKWTKERAETVLRRCQQEERIALNRAKAIAKQQDGIEARGQCSSCERMTAADALEQSLAAGADETLLVMCAAMYVMSDDELKRMAGYLVRLWRGQS